MSTPPVAFSGEAPAPSQCDSRTAAVSPLRITGLVAATCTPFDNEGRINHSAFQPMVEYLLQNGVRGLYPCGSTGEGPSLTIPERKAVATGYIDAAAGRCPVIVHVGHNSIADAANLAAHASEIGASAISATCPSYFPITNVDTLVACMAEIAKAAPNLPFYYYHIPSLTGSAIDMVDFLRQGKAEIPNLVGLKFTSPTAHEFQECLELDCFDVLWGVDEMLLSALATGTLAAIGSTYNIAPHLYNRIIEAFEAEDIARARQLQSQASSMIRVLKQFPFHGALKAVLQMNGIDMGPCRLPLTNLTAEQCSELRSLLATIGYFD